MKNIIGQFASMKEKVEDKLISSIGNTATRVGEQSRGLCLLVFDYEPEFPMELLMKNDEQ